MPNHWETSARPLFVKTVFVNGNRHAILFEKDPLLPFGNSPTKKISRSNSSLSFASDISTSSSESQTFNVERKTFKPRKTDQDQGRDLTSDLQNCLVKLKLVSGHLENKNSSGEEKCFCSSKALKKSRSLETGGSKQKKQRWNREKTCKKMNGEHYYGNSKEQQLTDRKSSRRSSCYVYNLENKKGKKNYCFVKISSQPSEFILNCNCEHKLNETHSCDHFNQNNFVISATIHNLVMTPEESENLFENVFENSELRWNHYLTRSYYNSYSDRIFQWLDLARRKKNQKEILARDESVNSTERIFSGKTYVDEIKKTEYSCKSENKILTNTKIENNIQSETRETEIEKEMRAITNIEKVISAEATYNFRENVVDIHASSRDLNNLPEENIEPKNLQKSSNAEIASVQSDLNISFLECSKNSTTQELNLQIPDLIKSPPKIQNIVLKTDSKENYSFRNQKETRKTSTRRNKSNGEENSEDDFISRWSWEKKKKKKNIFLEKSESSSKHSYYCCDKSLDEFVDNIKSDVLMEEFAVESQKSINNLNIMRTSPVSIQNLLSPQQQSKLTYLQEEKIVWASEKNTGRPQLHIFLPNMQLRDQTNDSMSECENFLNM